jgi:hypothetical protein
MEVILKYNLPEDNLEHNRAFHASNMAFALWDISQYLRKVDRHDTGDDIEKIRETFYVILNDRDINLDNLIE